MNNETPRSMVEWMLRPRGKNAKAGPWAAVRTYRAALRQAGQFANSDTVRGPHFWARVVRILTRGRLGTKCDHGHVITFDNLLVSTNNRYVILKCKACDAALPRENAGRRTKGVYDPTKYARNPDAAREACRRYYQKNRERLLAKANARNARVRGKERTLVTLQGPSDG